MMVKLNYESDGDPRAVMKHYSSCNIKKLASKDLKNNIFIKN